MEIDDNLLSSYEFFKNQKNQFTKALRDYDPRIIIKMDWKDLSEYNIRHKINWFIMFYPSGWEISPSQVSGVHFAFIYFIDKKTQTEYVRLSVGVEKPIPDQYKKQFKDEVVKDLCLRKVNLSEFDVWPYAGIRKVKLFEVKFPLDNNAWKKAMEYYKKLDSFISIVSEKIEEFRKKGYFK